MNTALTSHEDKVRSEQFPDCDKFQPRQDLIFVYPSEFIADASVMADRLQSAMDFLKYVTCLNPTQRFGSRVVVGYTRQSSQPQWSGTRGSRIDLPWNRYLHKENEPLEALSHELVHPFFRASPLHDSNEWWGEGFCDFLRGPVKNLMELDGNGWWKKKIEQARSNKQDRGGNVAGQLVLRAWKEHADVRDIGQFIERLIHDQDAIRKFVNFLYERFSDRPMGEEFRATEWIRQRLGNVQSE